MGFIDSLKHAWNVFKDPKSYEFRGNGSNGGGYGYHPNRPRHRYSNERSILASIFTRLGIDVAEADHFTCSDGRTMSSFGDSEKRFKLLPDGRAEY